MSTLAQMRSRIADDLNRSDLNTQIDKAINRAIRHYYNSERFWFNETTGTFATVANQEYYGTVDSVPSDILSINYLRLTVSSNNKPEIPQKTYSQIQAMNSGASIGQPLYYAWYSNKIWFYPIPDAIYTLTVSYQKSYAVLALDADTNDFTVEAEDLIEARASYWIYERLLKSDQDAARSKVEEQEALRALNIRTCDIVSTGQISSTRF